MKYLQFWETKEARKVWNEKEMVILSFYFLVNFKNSSDHGMDTRWVLEKFLWWLENLLWVYSTLMMGWKVHVYIINVDLISCRRNFLLIQLPYIESLAISYIEITMMDFVALDSVCFCNLTVINSLKILTFSS